jgi:hypothetical protein
MTGTFGDGTIQFNVSGNKPDSFVIKGDQTAGEDGLTIDNWEPRIQLKNRRDTDETWKISAPNDSSSLQFRKDSNLIAAIFPSTNGGGVTFGIAAAAALPGVAIASGASLSFDNTSANRIYRTASKLAYTSTESHNFNNPITVTGGVRPGTDNTYSLGTATLKWTTTYLDDYIEINSGGAVTSHAGAGRFWVSGTTPYFNASIIQLGTGVPATIADGRWADGTSSAAGLAIADYGAVANAISTVTAGYLTWNNDTSTLQVRKLAIGGASFSLGGQEVTDIKISSDAASTSNSDLVTAGYVDAHAGGGGTIGGSITDNQVAFGATTADSIEGSANLTYDGTNLTLARTADATSRGISIQDNEGTETIRLATASADQGLLYLKGPTGGNAIYLDGGTGVSYIDAGNVGIGTTAPDRKLDVNAGSATAFLASGTGGGTYGVARIVDNADSVPLELVGQRGDSEGPVLRLKHESASPNGGDYVGTVAFTGYTSTNALGNYAAIRGRAIDVTNGETDGALLFQNFIDNNRTTGMILSGAKLGVGPSGYTGFAPSEYLEVKSSADDDPAIKLYNARSPAASGALITQHRGSSISIISTGSAVAPFRWTIQSTEMMRLDDTGLGIGTTAPAHKLDVVGTTQLSGNAIIDGQLLNVTKTAKMDISGDYTMGTSYSHYTATSIAGDSPGDINVRVTTPASPTVGDEYWIVGSTYHGPGGFTGAATIDIIANTSQTINKVGSAIELAATASTSSATTPNFRLGHLLCVDTNTWALFISDYGPTS